MPKPVAASYLVNYPSIDPLTVAFSFQSQTPAGNFSFEFRFLGGVWNGWATLPSGEVRPFGCVPDVVDWTGFLDFGIVIVSGLPALGQGDLVASSSLYLIAWGVG